LHGTALCIGGLALSLYSTVGHTPDNRLPRRPAVIQAPPKVISRQSGLMSETSRSYIRLPLNELSWMLPKNRPLDSDWFGTNNWKLNIQTKSETQNVRLAYVAAKNESWFNQTQVGCLDDLWSRESHFDTTSVNPESGAYGIPQAEPPEKMVDAGSNWATNPLTQIEWGLAYIDQRYHNACSAWQFDEQNGYY